MAGTHVRVEWTQAANDDLDAIAEFISADNPVAAIEQVIRIVDVAERLLAPNPALGRPGRVAGTRELVVTGTPFIVAYRVVGETLQVLRAIHGARRWPDQL